MGAPAPRKFIIVRWFSRMGHDKLVRGEYVARENRVIDAFPVASRCPGEILPSNNDSSSLTTFHRVFFVF